MRPIECRGKRTDNGEWVEGDLIRLGECCAIFIDDTVFIHDKNHLTFFNNFIEVIPETVGQFTGLLDKNGKKIFEGDVVKVPAGWFGDNLYDSCLAKVVYEDNGFVLNNLERPDGVVWQENFKWEELKVIDNIHDNPELI